MTLPALLLSLLLLSTLALAQTQAQSQEGGRISLSDKQIKAHERATEAFRQHHYAHAFGRYAELADAGHAPSARMAMMMLQNGTALFGSEFSATTRQYAHWNAVVINAARRDVFIGGEERRTE